MLCVVGSNSDTIPLRGSCITRATLVVLLGIAPAACHRAAKPDPAPILLFAGTGTSAGDVAAVERVLAQDHLQYATATSLQLNRMSASELMAYRLVVVPGGNFMDMSGSLTPGTMSRVHDAVQGGVNYLGICAGAFLAGDGQGYYKSFNLTAGVRFGFYNAESRGLRKAVVAVTGVSAPPMEHYWEDGPELSGWGAVVGKYPDGTAAIVEGASGQGWLILVGVHPEAPESWRQGMTISTPARVANAYAATLVEAALSRTALPHY